MEDKIGLDVSHSQPYCISLGTHCIFSSWTLFTDCSVWVTISHIFRLSCHYQENISIYFVIICPPPTLYHSVSSLMWKSLRKSFLAELMTWCKIKRTSWKYYCIIQIHRIFFCHSAIWQLKKRGRKRNRERWTAGKAQCSYYSNNPERVWHSMHYSLAFPRQETHSLNLSSNIVPQPVTIQGNLLCWSETGPVSSLYLFLYNEDQKHLEYGTNSWQCILSKPVSLAFFKRAFKISYLKCSKRNKTWK